MDIIQAIANKIAQFVPDATIYRESIEQGFEAPSFYIHSINGTSKDELMEYQMRRESFCIMYFPDTNNEDVGVREQCMMMERQLYDNMDYLPDYNLKIKGKDSQIVEEALQFKFKVSYRVVNVDEAEKARMERLELEIKENIHG